MRVTFDLPNATTMAELDDIAIHVGRYKGVLVELADQPVKRRLPSHELAQREATPACARAWKESKHDSR